jgi:hypothetical protein
MKKLVLILTLVMLMGCAAFMGPSMKDRQEYVDNHFFLTDHIKQCILEKKITKGMTPDDVIASWGRPNNIHRSVGSWGTHEQWVYDLSKTRGFDTRQYVYFENNILISWQN